jgi:hypothetical protein
MAARRVYAADVFTRRCPISLFLQACTFALVVAMWTPAEGAEVPADCRANIDAKLPGWRLATPSAEVAKWAAEMKEGPTVLHVDLDGDGVGDTAALIVTGAGDPPAHHIAVCLSRKAGPELHVIDDLYCSDGIMIAKKGTRAHDFENFRYVTYRTNGVHAYCFEKAGATYLFRNGRFIRIVDSD